IELTQSKHRPRVCCEIGFAHRDAATVHNSTVRGVADNLGAVGITRPVAAWRYDITMCVQSNRRPAISETLADDQVGCRDHAVRAGLVLRHGICFDGKLERGEQALCTSGSGGTVAWRIIAWDADDLSEEVPLPGRFSIHEGSDDVDEIRHRDEFLGSISRN